MKPTFAETRKQHGIDRSQLARATGFTVDDIWALEQTGRGTRATWQSVLDALNTLAKTTYRADDFAGLTIAEWPVVPVE